MTADTRKRNRWILLLVIILAAIGVAWLIYWLLVGRFYVFTEDAYVHGNRVMLTPQVAAGVKAIYADETDLVEQGQLIVELDDSDHRIRFEELKKKLADMAREIAGQFQIAEARKAEIVLKQAQLRQAELDFEHREPLVKTGAVSKEEFEIYQTAVKVAQAALEFTEMSYSAAYALVAGTTVATHPRVLQVAWAVREAYLNLIRCQIWAPVTGYIAQRSAQVGDQVAIGATLLYIVPLDQIWIEANYKESQLSRVRIGQEVSYRADLYGREVVYKGRVLGFQPGSGNAFSLLPPENASGNWIKIIQRVPVRISVDPEQLRQFPLLLGLSMLVSVDTRSEGGTRLAERPTFEPIYTTPIYTCQLLQMKTIDPLIEKIIAEQLTK